MLKHKFGAFYVYIARTKWKLAVRRIVAESMPLLLINYTAVLPA